VKPTEIRTTSVGFTPWHDDVRRRQSTPPVDVGRREASTREASPREARTKEEGTLTADDKPRHTAEPTEPGEPIGLPEQSGPGAASDADAFDVVPVRHPGRWLSVAVIGVLAAMTVNSLVTNDRFEWDVVGDYLFSEQVLRGLWATIYLTLLAMGLGVVGGVGLAVMRMSPNPVLRATAAGYIWFFRGTPILVQLLFWGFIASLYPKLSLGVPFGPEFVTGDANDVIPLWLAAVLGLGLNEAAYMAEIVRAGLNGVDEGQTEAAAALGMPRGLVLRRVVLPQAMRIIVPPTGNETIAMLKTTSLVYAIAFTELLYAVQLIYSRTYRTIPMLIVAAIWYLVLTSVLTVGQHYLEKYYNRSSARYGAASRRLRDQAPRAGATL
jgi:polar amino acid transport system permease protein